jgi:GNAT superfamily N-acetyltransferase/dephospho-CoA kinase
LSAEPGVTGAGVTGAGVTKAGFAEAVVPKLAVPEAAVTLALVGWDDADLARMRDDQQAELATLYDGEADLEPVLPPEEMLATVAVSVDGVLVGCGSLRDARTYGDGYGELKRMYVRPAYRGRGLSRLVLARLEQIAAENGLRRLILETGTRQVEAIRLYRSAGYRRIPDYGPYDERSLSVCYARWLVPDAVTHLLAINGTVGAGKTSVAEAVVDALRERGIPYGWVDVDALRRVYPTEPDDPFAQAVVLDHLAAMAGVFRRRGYRHLILAEVIERRADRELYERAFDGADLTVVRLTASEATRLARIGAREHDDRWRAWHLARSVELEAILDAAGVDDAVVENDGRPLAEVAAEVLTLTGW